MWDWTLTQALRCDMELVRQAALMANELAGAVAVMLFGNKDARQAYSERLEWLVNGPPPSMEEQLGEKVWAEYKEWEARARELVRRRTGK